VGTGTSLVAGLGVLAPALAGAHHWSAVLVAQFLTMGAHGINFPCAQSGAVAPFPQQAGAAAGLLGFFTMVAALLAGIWVGMSHDGSLLPLATISAAIGTLLFAGAALLRRHRNISA